ncbi:MAG: hypothetical protein WCT51_00950 [Candidatus Shapirobacteria bacterium]|jgi:uncharacterized repeat protein (TIGR01451 family)
MKHKIINISLALGAMAVLFLSLFSPTKAFGYDDSNSTKNISIDKKVRSVDDSQYYDNIESSKKTFYEKDVVEFQVEVKNIGTGVIYNINVKDMLPKYLSLIFYPGKFDNDQYIVEWNIDKLEANESKTYLIRAKINDSTKLNVSTKQTNKAEACGAGQCDVDTASYFIGKATVPATGASDIAVKTILVTLLAVGGFSLRKFVRGY